VAVDVLVFVLSRFCLFCFSANTDVVFLQVDVDACGDVAEECEVNCMPTFHFYKAGNKVDQFEGASEDKLKALIAKHK
jgi:thioredoxin 1